MKTKCEKEYVEKVNPHIHANFGIKVLLAMNTLLPHSEILPQLCWQKTFDMTQSQWERFTVVVSDGAADVVSTQ